MKRGIEVKVGASAVQGPRGLSIKEIKLKETSPNGDNIYQIIIENDDIIGEFTSKKGDKGDKGDTGEKGRGILSIKKTSEVDRINYYTVTYTDNTTEEFTVEDGYSAYDVAVNNGFEGGIDEWLESLIGKGLEFEWKGTQLGVRIEGETEYKYVDLKGQDGINGKSIEFNWRGTELGVRVQGQSDYQYVNLKGETGQAGVNGTNGADGVGIKDITLKGQDSNGGNVYTITFTNETTKEFTAPRGPKGEGAEVDLSNYFTKAEIEEKLKNFCPIPVGGVLPMWNETNPANLYLGTTWELLTAGRYIQSGNTALQTGGSNSVSITKTNLPNVQLQVNSFSLTRGTMEITGYFSNSGVACAFEGVSGAFYGNQTSGQPIEQGGGTYKLYRGLSFSASRTWQGNTSSASPYTQALGSGTALTIQPAYITLKFWKRLT